MRLNKNIIITAGITLVASIAISALIFKPMGTVATEKNNAELYVEMKENAKEEVKKELQVKFDNQLAEEVKRIKEETDLQIKNLKVEYDKAIADAKLEQANNLASAIEKAQVDAQAKINHATSPEEIDRRRQEDMKNNPEKYGLNDPINLKPNTPSEPSDGES
jgi:hypothetical protein